MEERYENHATDGRRRCRRGKNPYYVAGQGAQRATRGRACQLPRRPVCRRGKGRGHTCRSIPHHQPRPGAQAAARAG